MKLQGSFPKDKLRRTSSSTNRLQRLYNTGNYICTHRRYGIPNEEFHLSLDDSPIGYSFLEVKLVRK